MKKAAICLVVGAIAGPALMGLLQIIVFAAGLGAIIAGGLYLLGGDKGE